jgi:hypothetical protein
LQCNWRVPTCLSRSGSLLPLYVCGG